MKTNLWYLLQVLSKMPENEVLTVSKLIAILKAVGEEKDKDIEQIDQFSSFPDM